MKEKISLPSSTSQHMEKYNGETVRRGLTNSQLLCQPMEFAHQTWKDATSCCSFPFSGISPLQAMAGGWQEDLSIPVRAGEQRDEPVPLRKPLRSQKEKRSMAERLGLGFTLVSRKSPLGCYLGKPVPSKTCSFCQILPRKANLGVACQPVAAYSNTTSSHGASAGPWLASAALRTGHAVEHGRLGGSRIQPPPSTKLSLGRARLTPSPRAATPFKLPSSATKEPKPTSRSNLTLVQEAVEARRVQLAEWQAARGKVLKRPPFVLITAPPRKFFSKEHPAQTSWISIADEEETILGPDQGNMVVLDQPSSANRSVCREEVGALGDPKPQGAQALVENCTHLHQPAGAAGNACCTGKGAQPLADDLC